MAVRNFLINNDFDDIVYVPRYEDPAQVSKMEDRSMAEDKGREEVEVTEEEDDEEPEMITLEFEDDTKVDCEVMGIFDYEDKDYIALIPDDGTDDVYIYGYQEYDDGSFELEDIEDDELFAKVAAEFESIMNDEDDEEEEK